MVVCKFFQQGSCRYGQNCRFEHVYGSKYSYHANTQPEPVTGTPAVTDEQLVNQVHTDLQSMIRGGQWLLSSYAPFKEKPTFPGLTDMSPEEARLFIYEAKANNNIDQAMIFMNNMFQEQKQKYETLLQKNPNITKVLRSLYNGENVTSPFMNQSSTQSFGGGDASSVFRSAVQPQSSVFSQATPSIFGQNNSFPNDPAKSVFSQASQNAFQNQNQTPSIFGGASNQPAQQSSMFGANDPQSVFAQAQQTAFGQNTQATQNVFDTQNSQNSIAQNIFATANAPPSVFAQQQPNVSPFNQQQQNASPFNQQQQNASLFNQQQQNAPSFNQQQQNASPFNQQQNASPFNQQSAQNNMFQRSEIQNQNVFGATNVFQQQNVPETGIYSRIEDISAEDLEAFKSDEFKMGFVPDTAPPRSLCI